MATTPIRIADLGDAISEASGSFVKLSKVSAPYTTIVNRAKVTDFSNDLLPRMGIQRFSLDYIQEVRDEFGSAGERVWKPMNDVHDSVRFVGNWQTFNDSNGLYIQIRAGATVATDYMEIVFYGTGLNLLVYAADANNRGVSVSIDGGASTSVAATGAGLQNSRGYKTNQIINVASNLTLGMHTAKINHATSTASLFYGYEVITLSGTSPNVLQLTPGSAVSSGKKLSKSSLTVDSYNSNFESGTLGTRGGRVVVYQKSDGTVAKAVNPAAASASYLSSANHSGESIVRQYHWREFGAGRSDDFSRLSDVAVDTKAFTLDDGTGLLGTYVFHSTGLSVELVVNANSSSILQFTFVGTGLDIIALGSTSPMGAYPTYVDGASVGNVSFTAPYGQIAKVPLVSGLPYGTHVVKVVRNNNTENALYLRDVVVYAPSKPSIPSGAIELADYCVMANYAANSTAGTETVATGVLRKPCTREMIFVDGTGGTTSWNFTSTANSTSYVSGFTANTDRQNAYFELVFFGTGFEHRFQATNNRSANIQVALQSISTGGSLQNLTTTNFPTISTSVYGTGVAFTASTGILDQLDASTSNGSGFRVSGLPLGVYKVRFTNNTASSYLTVDTLDIIAPIYSVDATSPLNSQNNLALGNNSISDNRVFSEMTAPVINNWAQAFGVLSGPSSTVSSPVPIPDMSVAIKTSGNPIEVCFNLPINTGGTYYGFVYIFVDSLAVGPAFGTVSSNSTAISGSVIVPVSAGYHKIDLNWQANNAQSISTLTTQRNLTVKELK